HARSLASALSSAFDAEHLADAFVGIGDLPQQADDAWIRAASEGEVMALRKMRAATTRVDTYVSVRRWLGEISGAEERTDPVWTLIDDSDTVTLDEIGAILDAAVTTGLALPEAIARRGHKLALHDLDTTANIIRAAQRR